MARTRKLNVLISDKEWEMLQQIAQRQGVTASDVVRMMIREKHRETFDSNRTKQTKK